MLVIRLSCGTKVLIALANWILLNVSKSTFNRIHQECFVVTMQLLLLEQIVTWWIHVDLKVHQLVTSDQTTMA